MGDADKDKATRFGRHIALEEAVAALMNVVLHLAGEENSPGLKDQMRATLLRSIEHLREIGTEAPGVAYTAAEETILAILPPSKAVGEIASSEDVSSGETSGDD